MMKEPKKILAAIAFAAVSFFMPVGANAQFNWPYIIKNGQAVTDVPARPAGQENVLNLATPKLSVVRVGFVGLEEPC